MIYKYEAIPNSIRLVLVAKVTQKHPNTLNKMARIWRISCHDLMNLRNTQYIIAIIPCQCHYPWVHSLAWTARLKIIECLGIAFLSFISGGDRLCKYKILQGSGPLRVRPGLWPDLFDCLNLCLVMTLAHSFDDLGLVGKYDKLKDMGPILMIS